MVSISIERILSRAKDLDFLERNLRNGREQTGEIQWPFGDLIRATLADVHALVDELGRHRDEPSVIKALVGLLRAEGYQVTEPEAAMEHAPASGLALPHDPTSTGAEEEELARRDSCPNCKEPTPAEGVCSHYLDCPKASRIQNRIVLPGEWEHDIHDPAKEPMDDGASEAMGTVCPKCKGVLVATGGPCSYPECASSAATPIGLASDMPGAGPSPTGATPPTRQRAEEPKILAADWSPDAKDLAGIAEVLGRNVETIATLVAEFKDAMSSAPPQSRWRPAFCSWARKNRPVTP